MLHSVRGLFVRFIPIGGVGCGGTAGLNERRRLNFEEEEMNELREAV